MGRRRICCWVSELRVEYDGKVNGWESGGLMMVVGVWTGWASVVYRRLGEEGWNFFLRLVMYQSVWGTW